MSIDLDPTETPVRDLRSAAATRPHQRFVTIAGRPWTHLEMWEWAEAAARGLRDLGVESGGRVVIMAPNVPESLHAWFGVQLAGAVDAPISVEAAGAYLAYVIDDLDAVAVVGTPETLAMVSSATDRVLPLRVVIGDRSLVPDLDGSVTVSFDELVVRGRRSQEPVEPPDAWTLGTIMYSSGTTGPSKGVMLSQGYYSTLARVHATFAELRPGSRFYCVQPLCHIDARSAVIDALHLRGEIVLGSRFSASRFWSEVEECDADVFLYVGTMIHLLFKQSEREIVPRERRRIGFGSATPASAHREFERRFGVDLVEGYGMTEFGLMAGQRPGRPEPGTVGPELDWVEARLVDEHSRDVGDGQVGELVVRPRGQHLHMMGYWRKPEATVKAWRGLWFHTGDLLRRLPSGSLEYIGRTKDSIRRRGENISAWEVEEAAAQHPGVLEAAAIGVPSDVGDEDVALFVVPSRAGIPDLAELREAMGKDVPRYALPRFIEIVSELPKTPSERVAKAAVRERGITAEARDFDERRRP
ncbi:AMP-binding protein [Aeromicrobium sp. CTD01-1L150]|uniref:AMP-binding protein n=1 Tax=Aeromicrobium sp. CTD01-1L150 TaxID=3341830 RepID=UPI0035C22C7A